MTLRVLHVWNTAGVASVIAKFADRAFHSESTVITRKAADRTGLTTYGTAYGDGAARFFLRALRMSGGADVVHVHSLDRVVPWIKRLHRVPVVMHYHGTDIEGRWQEKKRRWGRADLVAVAAPYLLDGAPPGAVSVPNPVDTDTFRRGLVPASQGAALSFHYGADAEAEALAKKLGLTLAWLNRGEVGHAEMPKVLGSYAYYIDVKRSPTGAVLPALSRTGLEALACGCRVVDSAGTVAVGLPQENDPARVAARWHEVYEGLLRK